MSIAVIQTGGKQYLVKEGQVLHVEKLELEPGASIEFDVLLLSDEDAQHVDVGTPHISGAKVKGVVLEHGKAEKVSVIKYKPKVRYRRNVGHRQPFTKIKIEKIAAS